MKRTVPGIWLILAFLVCATIFPVTEAQAGDWPWWRGPNFNGVAEVDKQPPIEWSARENVIWKTPVPGRGHSSPTIVGNRIFLATADEDRQQQGVVAFDRETGEQVWVTEISSGGFPKTHPKNTHATCTIACDGERLFVVFHHHAKLTLAALSVDGKKLWARDIGSYDPRQYEYGYAPSPLLYGSTVIVAADYEKGGYLAAHDVTTGDVVWKTDRPKLLSFSSPVVAHVAGRDQLLISGCERIAAYDPATGNELWHVPGTTMATCGTMVWDGDLVFASGGYPDSETICVKADGSAKIVWQNDQKCYEQSMLAHDGYLYALTDKGVAYCWRAADGQEMWRERLAGPVSASPVLAGDTIYQSIEKGTTFVFKANPEKFELLARNQLGTEAFATPSICDGRIYTRVAQGSGANRKEFLYCLGEKKSDRRMSE
ncbi:MAG: PQQ-binding-like beta-propeller repeat protein [Planctomycetaceae bacterium]|nr:PQQ-binding-like beta-propeller repeat protein [Planctomycetaceae bacterium]